MTNGLLLAGYGRCPYLLEITAMRDSPKDAGGQLMGLLFVLGTLAVMVCGTGYCLIGPDFSA